MKEVYIKLQTINDVRKLVSVVEKYPFSVDLSEGRYLVDAKSLMGIFSLDLLQPIKLIAEKDDPNLFEELKEMCIRDRDGRGLPDALGRPCFRGKGCAAAHGRIPKSERAY